MYRGTVVGGLSVVKSFLLTQLPFNRNYTGACDERVSKGRSFTGEFIWKGAFSEVVTAEWVEIA